MPIVRPYPIGEVSPQPIANVAPSVPAAGEVALFGGNQARDLQLAGQNLGQASDQLFALYQRHAQDANDTRVQDLNNRFIDGSRAILKTGPDAYYNQTGAGAIQGADAATGKPTTLRDEVLGQTANDYQRQKLAPILDAHLAASTAGIMRHTAAQQAVYSRGVAASAIQTSRAEATADPSMMVPAVMRAEGAARVLHAGQPPEAVETGVRAAGASIVAGVIGDRLARNDPEGVALFRQYSNRLEPRDRRTLGAAAETLSNTVEATDWLRDRSSRLDTDKAPTPTGDPALDAVNTATASAAELPPVVSSSGALLDQDGIAGTRERLDAIEERRRALTALNESEFAADPARLRANQAAIDTDTARGRATVKADADSLHADLRRHLTTGGPSGGPAVTPPPATIMSRLTDAQQDAVSAQVNANIEGRKTRTDPQTWYTIRQGLTGDDANERQRWASKNLVQFMGRLSDEDFTTLEKLQTAVRTNDGGAEQSRLQAINHMANDALRSAGIDPTPRPDTPLDSDAAQAAKFHRSLQDELSAFESRGRKPTEVETYDIVNSLKDTAIKSGWLKANDGRAFPTVASDVRLSDDRDGALVAQAGPSGDKPREGRSGVAPVTEPYPGSPVYRDAQQLAESLGRSGVAPPTEPPSNDPDFIKAFKAWPGMPVVLPNGDHIEDPNSPTGYVMAPFPGLQSVVKAARRARSEIQAATAISSTATPFIVAKMMHDALQRNVDHGGDFDYQRQTNKDQKGGFVQLQQFRNISNVNVGLFCQQVGLPRAMALTISGTFAALFSNNQDLGAPYFLDKDTKKYIDIGYDLGERGVFD